MPEELEKLESESQVKGELGRENESGDPDANQGQFYLHTFRDRNAAEKGYSELQARATRAEQENQELKKQSESTQSQLLQKLVDLQTSQQEQSNAPDVDESRLRQLAEEAGVDEKVLLHIGSLVNDSTERLREELKAETSKESQSVEELRNELNSLRIETDPDYQRNKARVDEVAEKFGISKAKAKDIVAELVPADELQVPSGMPPIGGGPSGARRVSDDKPKGLSDAEKKSLRNMGASDEEISQLDAAYKEKK